MPERDRNRVYCLLDTPIPVRLNAREYAIKGWFLPQPDLPGIPHLKLRVDGRDLDAFAGLPRPDVAEHFHDPDAINSGFVARFNAPITNPQITLFAQAASQEIILHEIQVDLTLAVGQPLARRAANYLEWLTCCEPHLFWPEAEVAQRLSHLSWLPLISVLVVTYDTDPYLLTRCIGSVLQQRYPHFELCCVDNCSADSRARESLQTLKSRHPSIRVIPLGEHGDVSTAYNHALMAAQGEIVTFLKQNDELHPFALLEIARLLNANQDTELMYSDEDQVDYLGARSLPAFKPDFDQDAFLSFNYIGSLIALKRSLALRIGGFRPAYDGAADWDFLLRAVGHIDSARIHHISKPLYHRRADGETAITNGHTAQDALQRSLAEYVRRTATPAQLEPGLFSGSMRLQYTYRRDLKIAIFLRAEDGAFQVAALRHNLDERTTTIYELIDCVIRPMSGPSAKRPGYGELSSYAAPLTSLHEMEEQVCIFINAPLETINHFFVQELVSQAMREDCGLVTGLSINTSSRILHSGFLADRQGELLDLFVGSEFPSPGYLHQLEVVRAVDAISDHFFAVRRDHLAIVGGLGSVSASRMPLLVCKLIGNARSRNLRILVTPYSVATFGSTTRPGEIEICKSKSRISANPNFSAFCDLEALQINENSGRNGAADSCNRLDHTRR